MNSFRKDLERGLAIEIPAAEAVAKVVYGGGTGVYKTPPHSEVDFVAVDSWSGEIVAFLEVKARSTSSEEYESTIVVSSKTRAAKVLRNLLKVPVIAIIVFTDTVGVFNLWEEPDKTEVVRRGDRGTQAEHNFYNNERMRFFPELRLEIPQF